MTGAVIVEDASWSARLFSWCGIALIAAAVLMVVATVLHPSRETATTIVASEPRLVAAHVAYTFAWLLMLLGLPGFYAAQRGGMGRLGLAGFLTALSEWIPPRWIDQDQQPPHQCPHPTNTHPTPVRPARSTPNLPSGMRSSVSWCQASH